MQKQAFDTHPLWKSLETLQDALDKADSRDEGAAAASLGAIRYVISLIRSHQKPNDTAPYSLAGLNAVNSNMPNITNEVINYANNGNVAHLLNAENYADPILNQIGSWPTSLLKGGAAAQANKVFSEYRDDATRAIKFLRESNASLRQQLASQTQESSAALDALKTEMGELTSKIKQDETRLDSALTGNNDAFIAKQTERQEKFTEWLEQQAEQLDARAMTDLSEVTHIRRRAEDRLTEIEKLHTDVEKVSSKAAAAILAKDYGSYSTREWVSGVVAYVLGFSLLVSLGFYLVTTIGSLAKDETVPWQYVGLKLGLTITAIAASGVAFQFGSHALSRANTNKRVQLELGAIGTFLADVDDEEQVKKAKVDFVNRMFGRAWDEKPESGSGQGAIDLGNLAKLADVLGRIQGH